MPLVYCDLNFVVTTDQGPDAYKNHLRTLVSNGVVTFVFSPVHWIEAAEDNNTARGDAKANLMDSLGAQWVYERRSIQRKEVAAALFRFLRIPGDLTNNMVGSARDVISDLAGRAAERDSRAFVSHLRQIGPEHILERNLRQALETSQLNSQRFHAGQLNPTFLNKIERLYVQQLLPDTTPSGVVIDVHSKEQFLNAYQLTDLPGIAIEHRTTQDNWYNKRQLTRNNFMDQQHLIALPYVDYFITDDTRLTSLISAIAMKLPFKLGTVLSKAEFDRRHP